MAKVVKVRQFITIEMSLEEAIKCHFGISSGVVICDNCDMYINEYNNNQPIVYIPMTDSILCKHCAQAYLSIAFYFKEDAICEKNNYNIIAQQLGLELI